MVSIVQATDLETGENLNGDYQKHDLIYIYENNCKSYVWRNHLW